MPPRRSCDSLAAEADRGVRDVGVVWQRPWSHHPVIVFPKSQSDMAALIGNDGKGLSQIAAVTTGSFESGLSRGDRVVVNPSAWRTLGSLGRRVVLAHEMTHLATRAITVDDVPIWLSEGFADYVAYQAVEVPTNVVAGDVLDDVRTGNGPKNLPEDADFDAARGDIAAAYEGAWLACRMIAERYGQKTAHRVVRVLRRQQVRAGVRTDQGDPRHQRRATGQAVAGLSRGSGQRMSEPASSSSAQRVLRVRLTSASEEGA